MLPMIGYFNLVDHRQLLLGFISGRTRVRTKGGLLGGNGLKNRIPAFLPLPNSLGFSLPLTFLCFGRASYSCFAHKFEGIDRSHFRDLTGRDEVRFTARKVGNRRLSDEQYSRLYSNLLRPRHCRTFQE
jgi:hypothetical protein